MKSARTPRPRRPGVCRTLLLLAVGSLSFLAPQGNSTASSPAASRQPDALAGIRPETRLRKLHLVRPDLIPYPIAYEVYC